MTDQSMKNMPDDFWKQKLTPEQYRIARQKGTEAAFSSASLDFKPER
jgi:peptide methionine sulfoxide reductase MsrB